MRMSVASITIQTFFFLVLQVFVIFKIHYFKNVTFLLKNLTFSISCKLVT